MSWLPLGFGLPAILWGLLALPVIWWLLRLTPPKPQTEVFPPLRILARVLKKEETPHQSPWWLTLLRLLMAALIVLALAEPVWNPRERLPTGGAALAVVMDNGWASAPDWETRVATARKLIGDASSTGVPVVLAFTAEKPNSDIGPFDAGAALDKLNAAEPRPVPVDRPAVYARVAAALDALPNASIAVLADGLAAEGDESAFAALLGKDPAAVLWAVPDRLNEIGLTATSNEVAGFNLAAIRAPGDPAPRQVSAGAFDDKGRRIADATIAFGPGDTTGAGLLSVPFELRNDFSSIVIDGEQHAAGVRVLDENSKRRRVGLLSQAEADQAQPLLSPLYYIRRALSPFADLVEPSSPDLAEAIPQLLEQKPAMIVMADVGNIPDAARTALIDWVQAGGMLIRFAGSRLAAAGNDEELLPVRLRLGERSMGGALSWTTPQPVTEFPRAGPFGDLPPPSEVTVTRQVLAEPTSDIVERTWASLADGTPLVTGARREKGTLVLFHVTPEATWSNLPISGSFVEMLRRLVQLSRNQGAAAANAGEQIASLAPYRMIAANGALVPPGPDARPLPGGPAPQPVTIENPPGLYGGEEGVLAHNLLRPDAAFSPIVRPPMAAPVTEVRYALDESRDLKGPLVAAALIIMVLDTLAVFWIGGLLARRPRRRRPVSGTVAAALLALGTVLAVPDPANAQDMRPGDAEAMEAIATTRLAYVLTGDSSIDAVSRAGLAGLSRFLIEKTALEPGDPAGVDIARDELAFYPIIYWPIDPGAAMPSEAAIARLDAYMQSGGTVLFDTRDQYSSGIDAGSASPATERLRDILSSLNVPPLEPVPPDHVLTKAFFILPEFPGRFNGGPLWVEASLDAQNVENRPVRTGDGVTPIMITANDFAGAWAVDENGDPLLPTVPADPIQRIHALRAGVNIMMYMLTGNYKS
ncbi:MAG: RNA-binding protein, partial [Rhizobiaceae bacterium]|nr:RNA-binding protein [Rhizobiaceae bacterium]